MARTRDTRRPGRRVRRTLGRPPKGCRVAECSTFTWRNFEQLVGDLLEGATALKTDPSVRRIVISGCVSVVQQLLDTGMLDELHLFVHPATAGPGLRLFDDAAPPRHLKLPSATPFATGVARVVYAPNPNPPTGGYDDAKQSLPQDGPA